MENQRIQQQFKGKENPCGKGKSYPKFSSELGNDALWRAENEAAIKNLASFPFSDAIGDPITEHQTAPGIAVLHTRPMYNTNLGPSSAMQKAADAGYNYIVQGFTTSLTSVQPSDLEMYVRAVNDGLGTAITIGKRAYLLTKKFSNYNQFMGRHLVRACGFDYDSLKNNLANFRENLNTLISEINDTLKVPNGDKILLIKQNMYSRVFTDTLGRKFQSYIFVPDSFPKFNESFSTGTSLIEHPTSINLMNTEEYFKLLNDLLDPLRNNADVTNMSGAILRTYKEEGCLKFSPLTEDMDISFDYDPIMLNEIHNADIYKWGNGINDQLCLSRNAPDEFTHEYIPEEYKGKALLFQDRNGYMISNPCMIAKNAISGNKSNIYHKLLMSVNGLFDIADEYPTPEQVLDCSAYKIAIEQMRHIPYSATPSAELSPDRFNRVHTSTDAITRLSIYTIDPDNHDIRIYDYEGILTQHSSLATATAAYNIIAGLSAFDYAPKLLAVSTTFNNCRVIQDLYNFTHIGWQSLANMMDKSWYGMVKFPKNRASVT